MWGKKYEAQIAMLNDKIKALEAKTEGLDRAKRRLNALCTLLELDVGLTADEAAIQSRHSYVICSVPPRGPSIRISNQQISEEITQAVPEKREIVTKKISKERK